MLSVSPWFRCTLFLFVLLASKTVIFQSPCTLCIAPSFACAYTPYHRVGSLDVHHHHTVPRTTARLNLGRPSWGNFLLYKNPFIYHLHYIHPAKKYTLFKIYAYLSPDKSTKRLVIWPSKRVRSPQFMRSAQCMCTPSIRTTFALSRFFYGRFRNDRLRLRLRLSGFFFSHRIQNAWLRFRPQTLTLFYIL